MVGKGALLECLDDRRVESVLIVVRHPSGLSHPKLREIIHQDFFDFSGIQSQFADRDACFFCLGVSSVGMSESDYYHLTYDLTLAAANAIAAATSQRLTFCYISARERTAQSADVPRGRAPKAKPKTRCFGCRSKRPTCFVPVTSSRSKASARARAGTRLCTASSGRSIPSCACWRRAM